MSFSSLEQQIIAEYNKVDAFIALRPKLSVVVAFVAGLLVKWVF